MSLWQLELKKAFRSPVVYVLISLFLFLNFSLLYKHAGIRDELKVTNELVDKFGYQIDEKMFAKLRVYYLAKLEKMNELTNKKIGKTYKRANDFFAPSEYKNRENFNKAEFHVMMETAMIENYYESISNIDDFYRKLDLSKNALSDIRGYGLKGAAAEHTRHYYRKLGERLDELVQNGEHKTLFFFGMIYRMHALLFKDLMRSMIFQTMVLVVLITAHIVTYEFQNRTHLTAYSSKRGRRLMVDKLAASLVAALCVSTTIVGPSLSVYFLLFDYSGLWHVPVSSFFNREFSFPYISWWKLPFAAYLGLIVVVFIICQLFFAMVAYVISMWCKNNYVAYALFAIGFGVAVFVPGIMPKSSLALFWTIYTPFSLVLNPHLWFMGWNVFFPKNYVPMTIIVWIVLLTAAMAITLLKFKKEPIH
ncbi:ABC transporter permease [Anoxybacteroides tepidamans]|uniref:ABC transporter permease n=1 Tax=Anoxybacteroides tepidamans TaxID=265948 RepID=UPI0004803508|nr:ABC transporter permease [Anoxybacillus tepidamans]